MAERAFDVVVLGAGAAGEVCAGRVANGGLEVAVVEGHLLGGECSYYACMPSKSLLRPAELLAEVKRVPGAAEAASGDLDVASALARRDEVIHDLDDSSHVGWLEKREIALFRGAGPARWRAAGAGGRGHAHREARRCRRDGVLAGDPPDRRARRSRPVGEPRGDDREARARKPRGAWRRVRRGRARAGMADAWFGRDADRGRGSHPVAGGAIRERAGRRRPAGDRRRGAHWREGERGQGPRTASCE